MPTRDLIVVGASAGGVEALRASVAGMPADLDAAIAGQGGLTIVQDPVEASCDGMSGSVLRHVAVDHVVSVSTMGALLRDGVGPRADTPDEPPDSAHRETAVTRVAHEESAT